MRLQSLQSLLPLAVGIVTDKLALLQRSGPSPLPMTPTTRLCQEAADASVVVLLEKKREKRASRSCNPLRHALRLVVNFKLTAPCEL